jgi:hypothetical protein
MAMQRSIDYSLVQGPRTSSTVNPWGSSTSSPLSALADCEEIKIARRRSSDIEFSLQTVIRLQTFDGYWPGREELGNDSLSWDDVPEVNNLDPEIIEKVRATLLALVNLEIYSADRRIVWELLWKKGLSWLTKVEPNLDWIAVIQRLACSLSF